MKSNIYRYICQRKSESKQIFALLIDPEKCQNSKQMLNTILAEIVATAPELIFVGGSQLTASIKDTVNEIKSRCNVPVVMFPGNCNQFADNVDAMLFLSLVSGRNPKYLIEQQIEAAPLIKKSDIETIPTGYILIDGGRKSAVQEISHTTPYKKADIELIVNTAIASELLGHKMVYLEAGSGALEPINIEIITAVKSAINIPLIVGGGISDRVTYDKIVAAGADIVVIGNHLEMHPEDIKLFAKNRGDSER